MGIQYYIAPEVFSHFPGYLRGVVIAREVQNGPSPDKLVESLRVAEAALRARLDPESITSEPRIAAWREAYRLLGVKPGDFRPSVDALARRVLKGDPLPSISTLVDIGTLASIQYLAPIGAHAIDWVTQDIGLRPATGEESFAAFGSELVEHPLPGEIIFVEGNTVLTRRWTWRQAKHTLVVPETRAVEFNVDGLPPFVRPDVEQACQDVARWVQEYCGGSVRYAVLSAEYPRISLD
jgi:DNA/RNA-binding domain of Phe-tRNA-synthetase-like protein